MTVSKVKNGRQIFMNPSTSPIFIFSVTIAIMSLGAITWANCELVSILSIIGFRSTTFFHGSRISCIHTTIIFSMIVISISVKSLFLSSGSPAPPSILSIIAYPSCVASSIIIVPPRGWKFTTPRITGLDSALVNSEKITVSELATVICIFFLR